MTNVRYSSGQAAVAAGVTRKAMRVYEQRGLVAAPERSAAGYRLYSDTDVEVLTFIRRARALGLSLDDIHAVLALRRAGATPCGTVRGLLDTRIKQIDTTIAELSALRATLSNARRSDEPSPTVNKTVCAIIDAAEIDA